MSQRDDTPAILAIRDRLQRSYSVPEDEATKMALAIYFQRYRAEHLDEELAGILIREHREETAS
jgi:hypothetical protein